MLDWHRLFGTMMIDQCDGSNVEVSLELDFSVVQQLLDCALLRKHSAGTEPTLPDGLNPLTDHTLISFKSHHESLNVFAIEEHIGHGVAYRKLARDSSGELLPSEKMRLVLVSARFPQALTAKLSFTQVQDGVYNVVYGLTALRVIVVGELPETPQNAPWLFFSARPEKVAYARRAFVPRRQALGVSLLNEVLKFYQQEGLSMPYTAEDFMRDARANNLARLTPDERSELFSQFAPEERLRGLPAEERLRGLPAEERLRGLSPDEMARIAKQLERLLPRTGT